MRIKLIVNDLNKILYSNKNKKIKIHFNLFLIVTN